jgi:molecular chaperone GrpE
MAEAIVGFIAMKKDIKNDSHTTNKTSAEQEIVDGVAGAAQLLKVDTQLQACQQELAGLKDKFVRVSADLQNFQARITKERALWSQEAQIAVFKELLPIVDNFERALTEPALANEKNSLAGLVLISKSLNKMLHHFGVREIDCTGTFDPQRHEALMHVNDSQKKPGEIVAVLQKGYQVNDVIIRPAKVSVA